MSVVKHVPVETGDNDLVGMVKLCDCCRRPWVLRKIGSPFGPIQKFTGQTVLVWTPEKFWERWTRRWWQFTLRFKGTPSAAPAPLLDRHMWEIETTTTETVITEPKEPDKYPYVPRFDEKVVSEDMKKKVWEE